LENPIDKDKVAENPGLLEYAHSVGGAVIIVDDKSRITAKALSAMEEQTNVQLQQIKDQMELLATQARKILDRVEISKQIYVAEMGFEPLISHVYYLYERKNGNKVLSMIAPQDFGSSMPFAAFIAQVKLLSDHTWDILDKPM
jgi:hypothetical protein